MSGAAHGPKLSYAIHFVTSEDKDGPATELHRRSTDSRGWHSEKFCDFPQEVIVSFEGEVAIDAIQILGHEFKIPTKVEMYLMRPQFDQSGLLLDVDSVIKPEISKLGYVSMNRNEQSGHKARELKTVQLNGERAVALKLMLQRCHINALNLYNQVALMGISVFGTVVTPFAMKRRTYSTTLNESLDLSQMRPQRRGGGDVMAPGDTSTEQFDPKTLEKIRELTYLKEKAVSEEDYDAAARLKNAIDRLKVVGVKIGELEMLKLRAVADEDYNAAKKIKDEIEEIRRSAEEPTAERPVRRRMKRQNSQPSGMMQPDHNAQDMRDRDRQAAVERSQSVTEPKSSDAAHSVGLFGGPSNSNNVLAVPEPEMQSSTVMSARGESPDRVVASSNPRDPTVEDRWNLPVASQNSHDEKPVRALGTSSYSDVAGSIDDTPVVSSSSVPVNRNKKGVRQSAESSSVPFSQILSELPEWEQSVVAKMKEFHSDLPVAEEAAANDGIYNSIKNTFGTYVSRCLLSPSSWQLREASIRSIEAHLQNIPGASGSKLRSLEKICSKLMVDKMAQVSLASLHAMSVGIATIGGEADKTDLDVFLTSFLSLCIERLGDSNARLRESCSTALVDLVDLKFVGVRPVLSSLISPGISSTSKQGKALQANWKFIGTRITTLVSIFQNFGHLVRKEVGLARDLVQLIFKEGLNHANGTVRSSSIQLLAEVYRIFGPQMIQSHLEKLRPVQQDEIRKVFAEIDSVDGSDRDFPDMPAAAEQKSEKIASGPAASKAKASSSSPPKTRKVPAEEKPVAPVKKGAAAPSASPPKAHARGTGGSEKAQKGSKQASPSKSNAKNSGSGTPSDKAAGPPQPVEETEDEVQDPILSPDNEHGATQQFAAQSGQLSDSAEWKVPDDDPHTCQFCGMHNDAWSDDSLDLHYWQDCPMLTVCQSCGQVVELASLNEHLVHECELKDDFAQCRKCGFAIQVDQLAKHQKACSFPPADSACPLCHEALPEGDWPWQRHFLSKNGACKLNPRTKPS